MPWLKQPGVRLDPTARIDRFADCVIAANRDEQGMVLGKCAFGSAVMTRPFDKRLEFSHRAGVDDTFAFVHDGSFRFAQQFNSSGDRPGRVRTSIPLIGVYGSAVSSYSPPDSGRATMTGPARPVRSIVNARRMNSGTRSSLSIYPYHLAPDLRLAVRSKCEFSDLPLDTHP